MSAIPVKARGKKWTIAYDDERRNRWAVLRETGTAYAMTPEDAVTWAYADGGRPSELFDTKRDALAAIADTTTV